MEEIRHLLCRAQLQARFGQNISDLKGIQYIFQMVSVSLKGIEEAYEKIKRKIHETPIISSEKLNEIAGKGNLRRFENNPSFLRL